MSDLSLYLKMNDGNLSGIKGSYVDDNLNSTDERLQKAAKLTLTTFEFKPHPYDNFNLLGNLIITGNPDMHTLNQKNYI